MFMILVTNNAMRVYHLDPQPHSPKLSSVIPSVTIAEDPRGKLPSSFSICVSLFSGLRTKSRAGDKNHFMVEVRGPRNPEDETDSPQKAVYLVIRAQLDYETMKNTGFISAGGAVKTLRKFGKVTIEQWSHICISVDAVTGQLLVMVNGEIGFDEVNKFLVNSTDKMPPAANGSVWFFGKIPSIFHLS